MVRWAISEGSSQSGTFLRAFIRLGFNQDETGRIVWDGSNPNIASRVIDLNRRFALPGSDVELYGSAPKRRCGGKTGTTRRAAAAPPACSIAAARPTRARRSWRRSAAAEIWNLRASFMLVGTDAKADIPLPDTVRRYFFPGVTHGGGRGGFSSAETAANGCELPANPAPSAPMRSALMQGARRLGHDRRARCRRAGIRRSPTARWCPTRRRRSRFPAIPGRPSPVQRPLLDYDLGASFNYQDASGVLTAPPKIKRSLPQLVVKIDADGNEVAGIKSPLLAAPLGTYTGWNVTASGPLKGQSCGLSGGFIPFAKTKAERMAHGDPRPSLEERYRSHDEYVKIVSAARRDAGA